MNIDPLEYTDKSYFIKEIEIDTSWAEDLGPDYKAYRERWENATTNLHLYEFPLCLEVESSYACNFTCPGCPRFFTTNVSMRGNLSDEMSDILFRECRKERLDSIFLDHGGEPLMNERFPEIVAKARDAGILDIMFSTNASMLTRDLSAKIIANGVTKINFSIDAASPEIYAITRPGGDYYEVLENIDVFLDEKEKSCKSYPRVRLSFIVQDSNIHELNKFFEIWAPKVNMVAFQKQKDFSRMLSDNPVEKSNVEFRCTQVFTMLMIDHMGNIHICNHDYGHKHILGNLRTHSIKECWHSDTMNYLRDIHHQGRWNSFDLCKRCVVGSL